MEKAKLYIPDRFMNKIHFRMLRCNQLFAPDETGYRTWTEAHEALTAMRLREIQAAENTLRAREDAYHRAMKMTDKDLRVIKYLTHMPSRRSK